MDTREAIRLYGTNEPQPVLRRLAAGLLSCEFENGALRHIRWGTVEIARGIGYLFRDRDWGTVPADVLGLTVQQTAGHFVVDFTLQIATPDGTLRASARIEGDDNGRLSFAVSATPTATLRTNRCGFVVLHPSDCAGRTLAVEHTDGRVEEATFPREISPSQPVLDIRGLTYSPADGLTLRCRLEAELPLDPAGKFEMEDQRNWSDASFKTYVGSLLDPWPYALAADVTLEQRVELEVFGTAAAQPALAGGPCELRFGAATALKMPTIGVGVPPGVHRATAGEHEALRSVRAGWWIVDGALDDPRLPEDLGMIAALRRGLGTRIQFDAIAPASDSPEDAARLAAQLCDRSGLQVEAIRILPAPYLKSYQPRDVWPDLPPLEAYASAARRHFPGALIGGGMFTYFTELNRKRPSAEGLDFIGHATCPIVHAADDVSVMETIDVLDAIAHSVRAAWPGLAYRLGPSTIAARRNPYGEAPAPNPDQRRLALTDADPRQRGQFGAAWTLAYAAAVVHAGLDVLALHHSHGPSGPFAGAGQVVPAWPVLRRLASAAGAKVFPILGLQAGMAGLAWEAEDGSVQGLLANLGADVVKVCWAGGDREAELGAYGILDLNLTHAID
ncbi:MAG: hypothetical protein Q7R30_25285 [Acidobacteriota bacterium]|nr:hypothetical protein [Acidobacteriota bacterium]